MSFWSTIGDIFSSKGGDQKAAAGTMNQAQVSAVAGFRASPLQHNFDTSGTGRVSGLAQGITGLLGTGFSDAISALAYVPNKADQALATTGGVAAGLSWSQAWDATTRGGTDINGVHVANLTAGQLAFEGLRHPLRQAKTDYLATGGRAAPTELLHDTRDTWTGRIGSGVIDVVATWYADPTIIGGKAARLSRLANAIPDAAAAEEAVNAATRLNAGETAARASSPLRAISHNGQGTFSTGAEESGWRLFHLAKSMDNGANQAGRQVLLARTPETAPFLGLMDMADRIEDLDLQRQVRIDIIGAASDSQSARQRLVDAVPEIARAQQRASLSPEGRETLDNLHLALVGADHSDPSMVGAVGEAYLDAASQFGTPENAAEIVALHSKHLKNIHDSFDRLNEVAQSSPLEQAGLSALDRAKASLRNHVAQDFHYQDSPSSRTVRILNWATNQRFRGTIATDHAIRGNQELMDWMTRAKIKHPETGETIQLFSGAEREAASTAMLTAKTQEQRRRQVDNLWSTMYAKVGAVHEIEPATVKRLAMKSKAQRQRAIQYTTKQLEKARLAGDDIVTLDDPALGTPTRLKAALLETHIANNVTLPDPMEIQKAVRQKLTAPSTMDEVGRRAGSFENDLDHFNHVWRVAVLGRPGILIRTQVDSQGRALAVMGGTAYVHSALEGTGNWFRKSILHQDDLIHVDATTADLQEAARLEGEAERLNRTAAVRERIALQRRGATEASVTAPTLQSRGAILRGRDKDTTLPLDADAIANMGSPALRARAEANLRQAETLRNRKYDTTKFRQGTQDETIDLGKGRSVTTRASVSGQDFRDLLSAEYKGGRPSEALRQVPQSMSDVLGNAHTREMRRLYEDRAKWLTYAPTDHHWSAGWIRTMDQLRNSYTIQRILDMADTSTTDLVRALRSDARVRHEWAEIRADNPDFDGWLARAVNTVAWNAPTKEVREALRTKGHMTPGEVDALFAKHNVEKMYVQGPDFSHAPPEGVKPDGFVAKFFKTMMDNPDSTAARHPVYVNRYRHHVQMLGKRELDRTGEMALTPAAQERIERVAKHRAVQDTQQLFYDTAKFTGAHNSLRWASPFLGAWQDAMESWSRLFYDNPAVAGGFNKIWNAPNRMGLVVDENGNAIPPGQQSDQSFLVLPMEFSNNFKKSKKMTIRKDSLNSIFQGAQWYTPGTGPLIQFPMQELVAHIYPELGDSSNPIVKTFLPFGTPKTGQGLSGFVKDAAYTALPSYAKALISAYDPSDTNNASAYLASVNSQIIAARSANRPIPSAAELDKKATAAARNAGFIRFVSLFGLGVSGSGSTAADFYKRQYDLIQSQAAQLHAQHTTPTAEFTRQFPDAAGLQWSLSKSQTGVNAYVQAWHGEKKYDKQIKASPEYGWFYVGGDNLNGDFSESIYNAQSSRTIGLAGSGTERQRQGRTQLIDSTLAEDGWRKYGALQNAIQDALKAQGLTSINQGGAARILAAKQAAVGVLRQTNPAWAKDFDDQDRGKLQRFVDSIATPATTDAALKNRPDIKAMSRYLEMRAIALQFIAANGGYKSLDATSGIVPQVRAALDAAGQALAAENLGFQQMWTRMFSHEVQSASEKEAA